MRRLSGLNAYICLVVVLAVPVAVATMDDLHVEDFRDWSTFAPLIVALLLSETMRVGMRRGTRHITIAFSSGFGCALVLVAPLGIAILAQIFCSLLDDLRLRRHWSRIVFNCSAAVLIYSAAAAAFSAISSHPTLRQGDLGSVELMAVIAACAVYFVVSHALINTAAAIATRTSLPRTIVDQHAGMLLTYAMEMSLAPTSIAVIFLSPWLVPLLALPGAVMSQSGRLAALREQEALRDRLTGLPNRAGLSGEFEELRSGPAGELPPTAVLLIDLDHFKEINDTLGHHTGDLLLSEVAQRLRTVLRDGDVVARLGGDEFAVLARLSPDADPNGDSNAAPHSPAEEAHGLAERLLRVLNEPFSAGGVRVDVQGSAGIALVPEHGAAIELLMSRADIALYKAKEGRGIALTYHQDYDQHTPERLSLLGELREAIEQRDLELWYQPKVDVATSRVLGVEALVRWPHPTKGLLGPYEFIPLAENTGLIIPLTMVVLQKALSQLRIWLDRGWVLGMSVNLSVRHLTDVELPGQLASALAQHGVPAHLLTIEVTESTIMNDPVRSAVVLKGMRELGISIAIDDYGTGYSSLAYLRQLEVDELKIDRSFISKLTGPGNDEVIVRSTIELGHNLGLRMVAEGVEERETWDRLADLRCDQVQGYLVARPVPAAEFEEWLTDEQVPYALQGRATLPA